MSADIIPFYGVDAYRFVDRFCDGTVAGGSASVLVKILSLLPDKNADLFSDWQSICMDDDKTAEFVNSGYVNGAGLMVMHSSLSSEAERDGFQEFFIHLLIDAFERFSGLRISWGEAEGELIIGIALDTPWNYPKCLLGCTEKQFDGMITGFFEGLIEGDIYEYIDGPENRILMIG